MSCAIVDEWYMNNIRKLKFVQNIMLIIFSEIVKVLHLTLFRIK